LTMDEKFINIRPYINPLVVDRSPLDFYTTGFPNRILVPRQTQI
jgi:hypothetical protein